MPLVLDPKAIPLEVLRALRKSLRDDLAEVAGLVEHPSGRVLDPAGLEAAAELVRSTLARLDGPAPRTREGLGADVNLAYASMLAAIDLVKAHTDLPRVPRRQPPPPS